MYQVVYSENSIKDIRKIDKEMADRIIKKIGFFSLQKNIFDFAKPLKGFDIGTYRFRIGNYRAVFKINEHGEIKILMILNIKHRKEIYF